MKFWTLILTVLAFTVIHWADYACAAKPKPSKSCVGQKKYGNNSDYILDVDHNEIKVMSYNVENLFDTIHNEGKDDYEFLPIDHPEKDKCEFKTGYYKNACKKTNWTEDRFELKLSQIRDAVSAQGELPDVLAVLEVENVNVVAQLADYLGYPKFLVTSGEDRRIELALLYKEDKIKLKEMKEVKITFPANVGIKSTRNILIANFMNLNNRDEIIGVYVNHWPSQSSPSAARVTAARHIRKSIDQFVKKYKDNYHVIALGDFNTIDKDNPKPFDVIFDKEWENSLIDVENVYRTQAHKNDPNKMLKKMAPSSYYYMNDNTWNHLDRIFVSQNLMDGHGVDVMPETFRIVAADYLLKPVTLDLNKKAKETEDSRAKTCQFSAPKRYFHNATNPHAAGYSDHLPLVVKVRL